jgi:hypothetical protein
MREMHGSVNPDPVWVLENKRNMMSQIGNTIGQEKKQDVFSNVQSFFQTFVPQRFAYALKPAGVVFLALVLTTSGWIASAYAKPGDVLWNAKNALDNVVEQGQLAFTAQEDQAVLHLKFATKRAKVIQEVADNTVDPKVKTDIIKQTVEELKDKMDQATKSVNNTPVEKSKELVKEVNNKVKEITQSLSETVAKVDTVDHQLAKDIDKSSLDTKQKSLAMIEVVVQKKTDAQVEISDEEKDIIKEHLTTAVGDMKEEAVKAKDQATGLVQEVKNSADEGKTVSTSTVSVLGSGSTASSSTGVNSTGTIQNNINVSSTISVASTTKEIVDGVAQTASQTVQTAETKEVEVKTLIQTNVLEAIKKTQELGVVVQQTVNTVEKTAEILPTIIVNSTLGTIKTGTSAAPGTTFVPTTSSTVGVQIKTVTTTAK